MLWFKCYTELLGIATGSIGSRKSWDRDENCQRRCDRLRNEYTWLLSAMINSHLCVQVSNFHQNKSTCKDLFCICTAIFIIS